MIDAVNVAPQTVAVNAPIVFNNTRVVTGCSARHEEGSGRVVLLKPGVYTVSFNANVSLPTGATVAPINLDITQDGEPISGGKMIYVPAAVDTLDSVSSTVLVRVYSCGCCVPVSVRNTSTQPITVQDANIVITREC